MWYEAFGLTGPQACKPSNKPAFKLFQWWWRHRCDDNNSVGEDW
jgi:hypothetical protein